MRSHAAIHAAEGQLYRQAIAVACRTLGLEIREVPARDAASVAARRVGLTEALLAKHVAGLKRAVGPPWGQDQKQAMFAAWAALAGGTIKRRRRDA
jgi:hypothetical protein